MLFVLCSRVFLSFPTILQACVMDCSLEEHAAILARFPSPPSTAAADLATVPAGAAPPSASATFPQAGSSGDANGSASSGAGAGSISISGSKAASASGRMSLGSKPPKVPGAQVAAEFLEAHVSVAHTHARLWSILFLLRRVGYSIYAN